MNSTEQRFKDLIQEHVMEITRLSARPVWNATQISALASQLLQASNAAQKLLGAIEVANNENL
jgi:hypothetical protein